MRIKKIFYYKSKNNKKNIFFCIEFYSVTDPNSPQVECCPVFQRLLFSYLIPYSLQRSYDSKVQTAERKKNKGPSGELYQTVSTVYFTLGISRMDL